MAFIPTAPLLAQYGRVLERADPRAPPSRRTGRIEAERRQPRRVDDALPDDVDDDAEPRVDADVAAERVDELVGQVPFLPGADVTAENAAAVPLVGEVRVRGKSAERS